MTKKELIEALVDIDDYDTVNFWMLSSDDPSQDLDGDIELFSIEKLIFDGGVYLNFSK